MDLYTALDELLAYAKEKLLLDELDEIYVRNTALGVLGAWVPLGVEAGSLDGSVTAFVTGGVVLPPSPPVPQERRTITRAITITISISRANITPAGLPFLRLLAMKDHLSMYHTSLDGVCLAKFPTIFL